MYFNPELLMTHSFDFQMPPLRSVLILLDVEALELHVDRLQIADQCIETLTRSAQFESKRLFVFRFYAVQVITLSLRQSRLGGLLQYR